MDCARLFDKIGYVVTIKWSLRAAN